MFARFVMFAVRDSALQQQLPHGRASSHLLFTVKRSPRALLFTDLYATLRLGFKSVEEDVEEDAFSSSPAGLSVSCVLNPPVHDS